MVKTDLHFYCVHGHLSDMYDRIGVVNNEVPKYEPDKRPFTYLRAEKPSKSSKGKSDDRRTESPSAIEFF